MKILITTTQVPFVHGGAEVLAENLKRACREAGHEAEIVAIPFKWYPVARLLDQMLACQLLQLSDAAANADRVIGLKFPAYLIPHSEKVFWVIHQHRQAYDLWDHPLGDMHKMPGGSQVRNAIRNADQAALAGARAVYTIAANVTNRLRRYCGIESQPIYHPPLGADEFYCKPGEDFLFFPSRISAEKRQALAVEALAKTRSSLRLVFAGAASDTGVAEAAKARAKELGVSDRIEWLGAVSEERKRELYARSLAVVYPPVDEDYGYVTLEAMLSGKPVITCEDSGGPLEFISDGENGYVTRAAAESLAETFDTVWNDRGEARRRGLAGREAYQRLGLSWQNVVSRLAA